MRILIAVTYYKPHWTGLTRYATNLSESLAKKGHLVRVVSNKFSQHLRSTESINQVKVYRTPFNLRVSRTQISPLFIFYYLKLLLKTNKVIIFLPLTETLFLTLLSKLLNKKTYLVHNGDLVLPNGVINSIIERIYYLTTNLSITLADGIVVHTKDYSQHSLLLSRHRKKWIVIPNPCKIDKPRKKLIQSLVKKYKLSGKILIGFAGRFVEEKGVVHLLKAIPFVKKVLPNAVFVFAGQKKVVYENYWKSISPLFEKYKEDIKFIGLIQNRKIMAAFYAMLDGFVLTSVTDCFPTTLIASM